MKSTILLWLARGLGSGQLKPAPGTWGSAAAMLIGTAWYLLGGGIPLWFIVLAAVAGVYICQQGEQILGKEDPGEIVWDEFVGMWISMWAVPLWAIPIAFALFRFFDISKIGPIYTIQELHGGLGVMADDILAGIFSRLVLAGVIYAVTMMMPAV